ncbi:hypothetical protein VPH35_096486 [Triticum aestivum]
MFSLLTGQPWEETSSFGEDLLKELSVIHERARKSMKSMVKALWPTVAAPDDMAELAKRFEGARRRLELWKISACREGVREEWAIVKTRFRKLEPEHMARVGPVGPDEQEIPLHLVYDQVMPTARLSQQDCALDSIIDNVDKE